jgi:membrane-associated phospholipid phosphatase
MGVDESVAGSAGLDQAPAVESAPGGFDRWGTWWVPALLFAAFVAVGLMVDHGAFRGVDGWGYRHLRLHSYDYDNLAGLGQVPVSAVILALAVYKMRDRRREAALWIGGYFATLAIEVVGKLIVQRPGAGASSLAGSIAVGTFPSGHTMRVIVVAGAVCAAWPRLKWLAIALAAFTAVWVELAGMHTVSEVLGGVLAGLAIVSAVRRLCRGADSAGTRSPSASAPTPRTPRS